VSQLGASIFVLGLLDPEQSKNELQSAFQAPPTSYQWAMANPTPFIR
jgi:hypothetical protein